MQPLPLVPPSFVSAAGEDGPFEDMPTLLPPRIVQAAIRRRRSQQSLLPDFYPPSGNSDEVQAVSLIRNPLPSCAAPVPITPVATALVPLTPAPVSLTTAPVPVANAPVPFTRVDTASETTLPLPLPTETASLISPPLVPPATIPSLPAAAAAATVPPSPRNSHTSATVPSDNAGPPPDIIADSHWLACRRTAEARYSQMLQMAESLQTRADVRHSVLGNVLGEGTLNRMERAIESDAHISWTTVLAQHFALVSRTPWSALSIGEGQIPPPQQPPSSLLRGSTPHTGGSRDDVSTTIHEEEQTIASEFDPFANLPTSVDNDNQPPSNATNSSSSFVRSRRRMCSLPTFLSHSDSTTLLFSNTTNGGKKETRGANCASVTKMVRVGPCSRRKFAWARLQQTMPSLFGDDDDASDDEEEVEKASAAAYCNPFPVPFAEEDGPILEWIYDGAPERASFSTFGPETQAEAASRWRRVATRVGAHGAAHRIALSDPLYACSDWTDATIEHFDEDDRARLATESDMRAIYESLPESARLPCIRQAAAAAASAQEDDPSSSSLAGKNKSGGGGVGEVDDWLIDAFAGRTLNGDCVPNPCQNVYPLVHSERRLVPTGLTMQSAVPAGLTTQSAVPTSEGGGAAAIASLAEFQASARALWGCDLLDELPFLGNVCVVGGAVTAALLPVPVYAKESNARAMYFRGSAAAAGDSKGGGVRGAAYSSSSRTRHRDPKDEWTHDDLYSPFASADVNLCLYGLTPIAAERKIDAIESLFAAAHATSSSSLESAAAYTCVRTKNHTIFMSAWPRRTLQISHRLFLNVTEVLLSMDMDCCAAACLGPDRVVLAPRCWRALHTRTNVVNPAYRSHTFERRLLHWSRRGFAVAVPNLEWSRVNARALLALPSSSSSSFSGDLNSKNSKGGGLLSLLRAGALSAGDSACGGEQLFPCDAFATLVTVRSFLDACGGKRHRRDSDKDDVLGDGADCVNDDYNGGDGGGTSTDEDEADQEEEEEASRDGDEQNYMDENDLDSDCQWLPTSLVRARASAALAGYLAEPGLTCYDDLPWKPWGPSVSFEGLLRYLREVTHWFRQHQGGSRHHNHSKCPFQQRIVEVGNDGSDAHTTVDVGHIETLPFILERPSQQCVGRLAMPHYTAAFNWYASALRE